jgi:hypothetical protein
MHYDMTTSSPLLSAWQAPVRMSQVEDLDSLQQHKHTARIVYGEQYLLALEAACHSQPGWPEHTKASVTAITDITKHWRWQKPMTRATCLSAQRIQLFCYLIILPVPGHAHILEGTVNVHQVQLVSSLQKFNRMSGRLLEHSPSTLQQRVLNTAYLVIISVPRHAHILEGAVNVHQVQLVRREAHRVLPAPKVPREQAGCGAERLLEFDWTHHGRLASTQRGAVANL